MNIGVWWHEHLGGRGGRRISEFEAGQVHRVSSRAARLYRGTLSWKTKANKQNQNPDPHKPNQPKEKFSWPPLHCYWLRGWPCVCNLLPPECQSYRLSPRLQIQCHLTVLCSAHAMRLFSRSYRSLYKQNSCLLLHKHKSSNYKSPSQEEDRHVLVWSSI